MRCINFFVLILLSLKMKCKKFINIYLGGKIKNGKRKKVCLFLWR